LATQIAFLRSNDKPMSDLTVEHLIEAFDLSLMSEGQMEVNPFSEKGALPSIALNVEEEGPVEPDLFGSRPASRSKASRISKRPR
jgi:hypothetical protein